jgi:hypothetical protein
MSHVTASTSTENTGAHRGNGNVSNRLLALAVAAALLIGVVHLPFPFAGDQSLFFVGARSLDQGGLLYRDFWDIKQPGLFWFHLAGGELFGFSEVGVHTFELLYMFLFAFLLVSFLKNRFQTAAVALVPLFIIGKYYLCGINQQTQIEMLVNLPLFLSIVATCKGIQAERRRWMWLALAGACGAGVLIFKQMLFPISCLCWLTSYLWARKKAVPGLRFGRYALALAVGFAVPTLAVATYFHFKGNLQALLWVTFILPRYVARELPWAWRLSTLTRSIASFAANYAVIIAFAFLGICAVVRRGWDLLTVNLVSWLLAGFAMILIQRYSWWEYHFLLLTVPLGILAAHGIEAVWLRIKAAGDQPKLKWTFATFLLLLFLPAEGTFAIDSMLLARFHFALSAENRFALQERINPEYALAEQEAGFLRDPAKLPGPIFVLGTPVFYVVTHRLQAVPQNGWGTEMMLPSQWVQMKQELMQNPPNYIFVDSVSQPGAGIMGYITQEYRVLHTSPAGTSYARRDAPL